MRAFPKPERLETHIGNFPPSDQGRSAKCNKNKAGLPRQCPRVYQSTSAPPLRSQFSAIITSEGTGWGWRLELQSLGQWAAIRFHNPISEADFALRIPA